MGCISHTEERTFDDWFALDFRFQLHSIMIVSLFVFKGETVGNGGSRQWPETLHRAGIVA